MTELIFYFPARLLIQYTDVVSTAELRELSESDAIKLYMDFVRNTENDIHTTVLMLPNLRDRFREYRDALNGLILGVDVKLYFSRERPEVPDYDPSELEYYTKDLKTIYGDLKLRKYKVIERIIITDMLFRLYYNIYNEIKDILKEYRKLKKEVLNFTMSKAAKFAFIERDYVPYDRQKGANVMNIHYPEQLGGFKSSCFPLLSWSGVLQMGMLHFFASGRWLEIHQAIDELKSGASKRGRITDPSDEFLEDCEDAFDRCVRGYKSFLQRFVDEVKAIVQDRDPIEVFILSKLPTTFFDLTNNAKNEGFDPAEVMHKLEDMVRRGLVSIDGFKIIKK